MRNMESAGKLAETWLSSCNFISYNSKTPLFILIVLVHMADSNSYFCIFMTV